MDKRIFDFTDEPRLQDLAPGQGDLTLLAGVDGFSMLTTDAQGAPVALREWAFDGDGRTFEAAEMDIRRILGSEGLLDREYRRVRGALFNAGATLVPRRLFRMDDDPAMHFRLLLPSGDYAYGHENLPECDCVVVWAVDAVAPRLLHHYFPELKLTHLAVPLLRALHRQAPSAATEVVINLRHQVAQIAIFERRNLLFYNTYHFRHANDLLYFALLAYDQFRLNPAEIPLVLAGNLVEDSDLYRQLFRYIHHLCFAELPAAAQLPEDAQGLPAHCHYDVFSVQVSGF